MVGPRASTWTSWKTSHGPAKSIMVAPSLSTKATLIDPWGGASSAAAETNAAIMDASSRAPQRDHRVDSRGATRRHQAGERADRGEQGRAQHEGHRVVSGDSEHQAGHDPG